ncbi:hypothetical protein NDU88_001700 [Pleurodeles waltl]|uniref:Uncharacterized protein n=1 Tax=Pleurodeles waltl TaxID=8319 RepID=A0AAV7R8R4_PLEWA|nr:hypothetical protein NDU88_001700 [Pleurodeles waltl]
MAPKSARNVADKTESVRQTRMAKEGSDGHSTGKLALGGLTKADCKINAGVVRDGKDQLRGTQPDNKPRDKLQSKTQPSTTDFLAYEEAGPEKVAQERTGAATGEDVDRNRSSEIEKVEYDGRKGEWLKDGGDKFCSLTEESEAASSGYDLNEEDGSGSSEAESLAESMSHVVDPQCGHNAGITSA